jgi:DNA-binding beta-propeller fold protein YncE
LTRSSAILLSPAPAGDRVRVKGRWAVLALLALAPAARATDGRDDVDPSLAVEDIRAQVIVWDHLYEGRFAAPGGVFCDRERGEIYVADTRNHRIGIFDDRGLPLFSFADEEHLREPRRVAALKDGRILVTDNDRTRIKIFSYRGEFLSYLAPPAGEEKPVLGALAVDDAGNVYVGDDAAGQVVVFDPELKYRFRFGSRGDDRGQFKSVGGIAISGKTIAVVDHTAIPVQLFDRAGNFLRGWGAHEMGAENFSLPAGVAIDAKGRVVVVDALRHEIKLFQQDGKFVGRYGSMGDGPGNVTYPSDVAVDGAGRLVVSETVGNRVQILVEVAKNKDEGARAREAKEARAQGSPRGGGGEGEARSTQSKGSDVN